MRTWLVILGVLLRSVITEAAVPSPGGEGQGEGERSFQIDATRVIIVVGAAGETEYGSNFVEQARLWQKACRQAGATPRIIGLGAPNSIRLKSTMRLGGATNDHEQLAQTLTAEPKDGASELWLVLIGHGTFDGSEAKFNLRGPDVSASELAGWLQPFRRPVAVINTASASAPFLNKLSASNRVVITATRSGYEQNYTRFGQYFAEAILPRRSAAPAGTDPQLVAPELPSEGGSDLDQDGQTSLLEAFLSASRRVAEFYQLQGRLATEHALIDDNGDGLGTPADWFRGVRAIKRAKDGAAPDGLRAHQFHLVRSEAEQRLAPAIRLERDSLELAVARLRDSKSRLPEDEYYRQLEVILLKLARLQIAPGNSNRQAGELK